VIVYLYRWRIKEGKEKQFKENWQKVTLAMRKYCGSLGSRLHVSDEGIYVGYAQWPDKNTREACKISDPELDAARSLMSDAVEERLPDVCLDVETDLLVHS
jgi:hypothetical protein